MSTLALADTTNTHSPGVTTRAAKKYSDGGTALGAYDAFGGGGAPPLPTSARAARHESPATTGGTPAPEAREVQTPTPLSSSTDADADDSSPSAARGWHVPPAASSTRPARERVPPDVAPPSASSADVRYLRAKVLALEGKCAELARENERAHLERRGPRAPAQQPAAPAPRPAGLQAAAARARLAAGPRAPTREAEAQATQRHDVFGELLATLGHKRVYLASARALIEHVPIWCRQRPVERARVAEIRAAKAAEGMRFPGVISVFEVRATGAERLAMPQPVGIFDGQHRLCAIAGELAHWGAPPPEPRAAAGAADGRAAAAQQPQPAAQGAAGGACSVAAVAGEEDPGRRRSTRSSAAADGSAYAHEPPAAHGPGAPGAEGGAASVPTPEQQQRAPPPAPPPLDDVQLVVDVYPVQSEEEVKRWYLELNKAETVKEIDLPDTIAPSKKRVIDEAVGTLRVRYAEMFKPSERCRPPHVHRDTLRNKLYNHDIVGDSLSDAAALVRTLERVNSQLGERAEASWPAPIRKHLEKARRFGFFLGLNDYGWLEAINQPQLPQHR